jgi:hypothetical protein
MPNVFEYEAKLSDGNLNWVFKGAHDHAEFKQTLALCDDRRTEDPNRRGFLVRAKDKQEAITRIVEIDLTAKTVNGFYIL